MKHQPLLDQVKRLKLTDNSALTLLQDAQLISDHCLKLTDIPEPDLSRAVEFLKERHP